ncbi:phosphate regulon sensor histidine kinase PhoR [Entomomonas asaccharolytica]|uniref:Phosphate regulon sensor protein PhoR n=1 Tax=Entomomonas asaccharolytica TaxID=2785331 RepID=A0A974NDD1_9GAMM|nr:phosphate regulon sensor histidine kinase PhoR [Entomomonas asaccharolytica]QQP84417.1 phosphate regulon sensor histidine kinase PhoR [Entomomonas asaccharolytica]
MSFYKPLFWLLIYIVIAVFIDVYLGARLANPILVVVGIFVFVIGWLWFNKKQFNLLISWLKQGAKNKDQYQFVGYSKEIADYVERLLKQRDQENQNSTDQLNKLLGAIQVSPNGVLLLDEDYKIEWCNATAAQHFSLDAELDLQQHITNLVRDPNFIAYLENKDYQKPLKLALGNDEEQKLLIQLHPYDEGRLLLLTNDITQLERVERMRRNFVADVSHEIRTPLTVLSGFIETIQNLPLDEAERKHYLDLMQQQGDRMQSLVNDLLTLARLEDSPPPPMDQWVAVKSILEHTENTIQELSAGQHKITVNCFDNVAIAGVESELISAVANIAINAVRYTKQGGDIDISFKLIDGEAVFQVKDSGQGIPAQHIKHLTQRFYRVDKSRSRETGGTGLGLSIVKHIVLRHGGRLGIKSIEGKGSTFSLIFPVNRIKPSEI